MPYLNNWQEKFATERPRRLLALDGGGIRGVMSLEILRKIESDLAAATGKGASFRLGDFFDYIGGTSTGASSVGRIRGAGGRYGPWWFAGVHRCGGSAGSVSSEATGGGSQSQTPAVLLIV